MMRKKTSSAPNPSRYTAAPINGTEVQPLPKIYEKKNHEKCCSSASSMLPDMLELTVIMQFRDQGGTDDEVLASISKSFQTVAQY
jgi:hypothetical protein